MGLSFHTNQLQEWLDRLREGDPSARAALLASACEDLRRLAGHMLRGYPQVQRWEATDDVLNEALLRLHRALAEVQPANVRQFRALAKQQIRWELIDLARHYYGKRGLGANHATDGVGPNSDASPHYEKLDDTAEPSKLAQWAEFHQAVEGLPDDQREAFSLRWYDGLSFPEIAELAGISVKTAQRRWRSACQMLYQAVQDPISEP